MNEFGGSGVLEAHTFPSPQHSQSHHGNKTPEKRVSHLLAIEKAKPTAVAGGRANALGQFLLIAQLAHLSVTLPNRQFTTHD